MKFWKNRYIQFLTKYKRAMLTAKKTTENFFRIITMVVTFVALVFMIFINKADGRNQASNDQVVKTSVQKSENIE